jgi:hypothetical protein
LGATGSAEVSAPTSVLKPKRSPKPKPDDAEWLAGLASDPTYKGLDVAQEHGKMTRWCETNGRQATRRRFVNWLNRCDKPLNGVGQQTMKSGGTSTYELEAKAHGYTL